MNDLRVEDWPHHDFHGESSRLTVMPSTSLKAGQSFLSVPPMNWLYDFTALGQVTGIQRCSRP